MSDFVEVLGEFKNGEEPEDIAPMLEDATLRNGLVAWKSVVTRVKPESKAGCEAKSPQERWAWLWDCTDFDLGGFACVAGVKAQDAMDLFKRLRGLKLIYPDGTIHKLAKDYLQALIMGKLSKAIKKPRGSEQKPAKPEGGTR